MNIINQSVNVDAFYFTGNDQLKTFPRRIELNTKAYTFEDGLQCLIRKGKRVVRLFDMTDGRTRFRLKLEDDQWTLIGTRSAV